MPLLRVSASDSGQRPTGPKVRLDLGGKNNLSYSASCEEPTRAACVDPSDKSSWHSGGSFQACFCVHVRVGCVFTLVEIAPVCIVRSVPTLPPLMQESLIVLC